MDKPENQDGIWEGDGPQAAAPSPTIKCEVEHNPALCSFPMCDCGGVPDFMAKHDLGCVAPDTEVTMTDEVLIAGIKAVPGVIDPRIVRKPKRDRAAYMRSYRAQKRAASTQ